MEQALISDFCNVKRLNVFDLSDIICTTLLTQMAFLLRIVTSRGIFMNYMKPIYLHNTFNTVSSSIASSHISGYPYVLSLRRDFNPW